MTANPPADVTEIPGGNAEQVFRLDDASGGVVGFLVIDSTRRGPAFGGIRRIRYASPGHALRDARRLARAMTEKCALAGLDAGGAKTALIRRDHDDGMAYEQLGELVEWLDGTYVCGPDVGTSDEELARIRRHTRHVNPAGNDAARSTADGVLAALRGVGNHLHRPLDSMRFFVQGLGAVGARVAADLVELGGAVRASDIDPDRRALAAKSGIEVVEASAWRALLDDGTTDVYVPCALGGTVDQEVASTMRCVAVAGSANNTLADPEAGRVLHARGIAFAPDVLTSAGAVIEGVLTVVAGESTTTRRRIAEHIAGIETRVSDLLSAASHRDVPPSRLAREAARAALEPTRGT